MSGPTDDSESCESQSEQSRLAEQALREGRYADAIAAADRELGALLHAGLSIEDLIRFSSRGAALESLMRAERSAVARLRYLHEPLALRWEALHRAGREAEARQMRELCIRHFPTRASVWAAAGNHALDGGQLAQAARYFAHCLRCNPEWTAGLAGMAIVCEQRKDWARALAYRERVVEVERALERDDAPSLQRVVRYGAALCRVGRWIDAGALLRRCVALRAFEKLPAERAVLARVFSRELYAPAVIAELYAHARFEPTDDAVALALREAEACTALAHAIETSADLEAAERGPLLGVCAWLCGDEARAYVLLDEAETRDSADLATQCFLAWSAETLRTPDRASNARFALEAARARLASAGAQLEDDDLLFALIIVARIDGAEVAERVAADIGGAANGAAARYLAAHAARGEACSRCAPQRERSALGARVRELAAFRALERAVGRSALEVAIASAGALRALTDPQS